MAAFEYGNGVPVKYEFGPRRCSGLTEFWANADKARDILGWTASRALDEVCRFLQAKSLEFGGYLFCLLAG